MRPFYCIISMLCGSPQPCSTYSFHRHLRARHEAEGSTLYQIINTQLDIARLFVGLRWRFLIIIMSSSHFTTCVMRHPTTPPHTYTHTHYTRHLSFRDSVCRGAMLIFQHYYTLSHPQHSQPAPKKNPKRANTK